MFRAACATIVSHGVVHVAEFPRERSSPLTRATISSSGRPNSSGVTIIGPRLVAKSFPFAGPSPTSISGRCRSRADQSFMIVKPPICPSPPITAATSSS